MLLHKYSGPRQVPEYGDTCATAAHTARSSLEQFSEGPTARALSGASGTFGQSGFARNCKQVSETGQCRD
eukprot:10134766-Alexandrium_andersonii.AAC.1